MTILGPDGEPVSVEKAPSSNGNGSAIPIVPPSSLGMEDWYEGLLDEAAAGRIGLWKADLWGRIDKDAIDRRIAAIYSETGVSQSSDIEKGIREYGKGLWVFCCVRTISANLGRVPLAAWRQEGSNEPEDQPDSELQRLLDEPHDFLTTDELLERAATYLELTGTGPIYAERQFDQPEVATGPIRTLRPLRPSRLQIVPGPEGIDHYLHEIGGTKTKIAPENVALPRFFDPQNDFWGMSPVRLVLQSSDVDRTIEAFNKNALERGGVPSAVLEAPDRLSYQSARRARRDWETRFRKGETDGIVVLDSGLSLKVPGFSPKDMQFLEQAGVTKKRILAAYLVPPLMVMDLEDASVLANAKDQRRIFYEITLPLPSGKIENSLTRLIRTDPRFASAGRVRWGVRFAYERIEALKEDDAGQRQQARDDYKAGIITLNEARQEAGYEPTDDGDTFYVPPPAPGALASLAIPAAVAPIRVQSSGEYKRVARAGHRILFRRHEAEAVAVLRAFFEAQKKRVVARLRTHLSTGKAHRERDYVDEDLLALLFPDDEENEALRRKIGPVFLGALLDGANTKIEALFGEGLIAAISEDTDRIRAVYESWSGSEVKRVNRETKLAIRGLLADSFEAGSPVQEIEKDLLALFRRYSVKPTGKGDIFTRAERIARTETNVALNTGGFEATRAAEAAGAVILKSWLSSRDSLVRSSHQEMDSATSNDPIPLGQPFPNGLLYPSDPDGPPEEIINCRCSMIETVAKGPD